MSQDASAGGSVSAAPEPRPAEHAELLSVYAVAGLLSCSWRHVYRLSDAGRMPAPLDERLLATREGEYAPSRKAIRKLAARFVREHEQHAFYRTQEPSAKSARLAVRAIETPDDKEVEIEGKKYKPVKTRRQVLRARHAHRDQVPGRTGGLRSVARLRRGARQPGQPARAHEKRARHPY